MSLVVHDLKKTCFKQNFCIHLLRPTGSGQAMETIMFFLIFIASLLTCATAEFKFTFDSFEEVIFAICVIHNGTIQGNIALMESVCIGFTISTVNIV